MQTWMKVPITVRRVAIAGRIADANSGQLMAGATVEIKQAPEEFQRWLSLRSLQYGDRWNQMLNRPDRTQTNSDGWFYFADLPDGDYRLCISLPNGGTRYESVSTDTRVAQGSNIKLLDIALPSTALKGRIIDPEKDADLSKAGVPIAKVQVEGGTSVLSDRDGSYLLSGLEIWKRPLDASEASGRPLITVSAQGYRTVTQGIWLTQGVCASHDFHLTRQ